MTDAPRILDQYGNPIPRSVRRSYPPPEVFINCSLCEAPYVVKQTDEGPQAHQSCACQVRPEHKGTPTLRDMLGGLPGWMEAT